MPGARILCMATVFGEPEAHPVAALVTRFHADLDDLENPRLWSMSDSDLARLLPELTRLAERVAALELARHHSGTHNGLGHAFSEYVTRYPVDRLPQAGGVDATVVVTMTLENLLGDSHTPALLDTGDRITAAQARQLACEAAIFPRSRALSAMASRFGSLEMSNPSASALGGSMKWTGR